MSWPMVKLGDIAIHIRNGASIKQNDSSGGLPISRIETIANREVNFDKCGYADLGPEDYKEYRLASGDILISHINSEKHLGKCAIFESDRDDLVHGMNLLCMRPKDVVFPKFVFYYLSSDLFLSNIPKITKKSVNQASFTVTSFKELEIPLPPIAVQKRIAAILDKADAIRRKRQQAIQLADDFLRAVFLQMFGDPVTNPKGWECSKLDDLVSKPITYGILKPEEFVPHGIPMLRIQDLKNGRIDSFGEFHLVSERLSSQYKRTILEGNEILISLVGTIGIVAQVPKELQGANVHRNLGVIQLKDAAITEFVTSFMQLPQFMTVLDRVTKGGVHKLLNLADLKEVEIPLPPIDLVKEFIDVKYFVASLKNLNEYFSNELFFESLSHKAFSGQL